MGTQMDADTPYFSLSHFEPSFLETSKRAWGFVIFISQSINHQIVLPLFDRSLRRPHGGARGVDGKMASHGTAVASQWSVVRVGGKQLKKTKN